MSVPQAPALPPAQLQRVETTEPPHQMGRTKKPATAVTPEPAPCKRVSRKETVTMTPGSVKMQPSQTGPHTIPYDTLEDHQL